MDQFSCASLFPLLISLYYCTIVRLNHHNATNNNSALWGRFNRNRTEPSSSHKISDKKAPNARMAYLTWDDEAGRYTSMKKKKKKDVRHLRHIYLSCAVSLQRCDVYCLRRHITVPVRYKIKNFFGMRLDTSLLGSYENFVFGMKRFTFESTRATHCYGHFLEPRFRVHLLVHLRLVPDCTTKVIPTGPCSHESSALRRPLSRTFVCAARGASIHVFPLMPFLDRSRRLCTVL